VGGAFDKVIDLIKSYVMVIMLWHKFGMGRAIGFNG
jgi:hypothetical protein